jgi:hypothetical protein
MSGGEATFRIRLTDRTEGLEYWDEGERFYFYVYLKGGVWDVILPPLHEESGRGRQRGHELTPEERARILPRVTAHLSRIKWFGLFPRSYSVRFIPDPTGQL